ncbi:MAG: hypothetical protein AAGB04_31530, partial [Pseudomonadota bacterium]
MKPISCSAVLLLVALCSPAAALDDRVRVATWNVLANKDNDSDDRYIPRKRIRKISNVIAILNPDVIALSEVAPDRRFKDL